MARLLFALLAHNQRPCLDDLLLNLRDFAPGADVVLFNGGKDTHLADGLDIDICPFSRPLRYEGLAGYHLDVMRWLYEERRPFDFLVTLDSDMLLVKPGLEAYLEATMAESSYMATEFSEIPPSTTWRPGRRFHYKWSSIWQPLFGTENPFGCFNPGQAFGRQYVERLMQFPKLDELRARIERSHLPFLEEMVFPTLAVVLDCAPMRSRIPDQSAIRFLGYQSPAEILGYRDNPDVFLIHPVAMNVDSPERELVRTFRRGQTVDLDEFQTAFTQRQPPQAMRKRLRATVLGPAMASLKDAYLRLVPE
jgi:hypothetical protein